MEPEQLHWETKGLPWEPSWKQILQRSWVAVSIREILFYQNVCLHFNYSSVLKQKPSFSQKQASNLSFPYSFRLCRLFCQFENFWNWDRFYQMQSSTTMGKYIIHKKVIRRLIYFGNIIFVRTMQLCCWKLIIWSNISFINRQMSLTKNNNGLTHTSLDSFIDETCGSDDAVFLCELNSHPNIGTISKQSRDLLDLFSSADYSRYSKAKDAFKITDKQVRQLRKLTILALLEGRQKIDLKSLEDACEIPRIEVLRLLVDMNTKGEITVKIDEKRGLCSILSSQFASGRDIGRLASEAAVRLIKLEEKNKAIMAEIKTIVPKEKPSYSYSYKYNDDSD